MASLLAIYGDRGLYKKLIKVIFMIFVEVRRYIEAVLTTLKKMTVKNLLSCLEALYHV